MQANESSESLPTTRFVRHERVSEPEIIIEYGLAPDPLAALARAESFFERPRRGAPAETEGDAASPLEADPSRSPGRSAALTVPPPRTPWPHRRRALIAVVAAALGSFAGVAILRGGRPAPRAAAPAAAALVASPSSAEASPRPPSSTPSFPSPSPAPPPPAAIVAPAQCTPPPAPAEVTVRVTSRPAGATVLVDGVRIGHAPIDLVLARSAKGATIKLRRSGYRSETIPVALDGDAKLHVTMQPKDEPR